MTVQEIAPQDWERVLAEFSRDHRAWLATVERVAGASSLTEARERPLLSVEPQFEERRIVAIAIRFQLDAATAPGIIADRPTRLRVGKTDEGATNSLEIETATGQRMSISFRTAPVSEALDGVAPGEL